MEPEIVRTSLLPVTVTAALVSNATGAEMPCEPVTVTAAGPLGPFRCSTPLPVPEAIA